MITVWEEHETYHCHCSYVKFPAQFLLTEKSKWITVQIRNSPCTS